MPQTCVVYRVLIASPSDCRAERDLVADVLNEWNLVNTLARNALLLPVRWETDARSEITNEHPQETLNKQLVEKCDIAVAVFWTRLGTPTPNADSGTVEEIERFLADGKPVFLYFSKAKVNLDSIDPDQYVKLKAFKDSMKTRGVVFDFESHDEFVKRLSRDVGARMAEWVEGAGAPETNRLDALAASADKSDDPVTEFRHRVAAYARRFRMVWNSARNSENATGGVWKDTIGDTFDYLVALREQIESGLEPVAAELEAIAAVVMSVTLARTSGDYREIPSKGDEIANRLDALPALIDATREDANAPS